MTGSSLIVANLQIRRDKAGRYCLNDLHQAAGNTPRLRPSRWAENQQTRDLAILVESKAGIPALVIHHGGAAPGTYALKPLVYAYAMWVSPEFHLAVIEAYDALITANDESRPMVATAALHRVRMQTVTRLYRAVHPAELAALHAQATQLSLALDLPRPELPAAAVALQNGQGTLTRFWLAVDAGLAAGQLHNHARRDDVLALNLPQVRQFAARSGIALPESTALTGALRACPRLLHVNRVYNSPAIGRAVKCWVFAK
ncbi:KilA-N domain-containing protein [Xanthomonas vasicola]|nr:KilA-N domain-containing protein [Xanthomonas vasicola]TWQ29220.1 KilA-N domain-containing protein [Xanthomonas vasicola]TWQ39790.1 KilA-N domain-containing protein [Xanthomonas vasicola]TWQ60046.1 KilA-N domain-containing protein [Xanthomonas vasicola]TWQ81059.1 KilA-N domain-containing protein [Xanthomonas vasicola]